MTGVPPALIVYLEEAAIDPRVQATQLMSAAVGEAGTIVFWNGEFWKRLLSGTTDNLAAVWGSGPPDLWVAGAGGVRHFNGIARSPNPGADVGPGCLVAQPGERPALTG